MKYQVRPPEEEAPTLQGLKLRPVTFRYKGDETGAQQYGLIAEEVEKVYPKGPSQRTDDEDRR
jgi:hypothetical protein